MCRRVEITVDEKLYREQSFAFWSDEDFGRRKLTAVAQSKLFPHIKNMLIEIMMEVIRSVVIMDTESEFGGKLLMGKDLGF